jgi:hypothetical protein
VSCALCWVCKTGSSTLPADPESVSYEAIWTGNGAICLDNPRIPFKEWPGGYACDLPACTEDIVHNWESYGWLRSGKPKVLPPAP